MRQTSRGGLWSGTFSSPGGERPPPRARDVDGPAGEGWYLRSNFSNSRLVRLLGHWMPADDESPRQDVAERLAQWLSVADVIRLHAAHESIASLAAPAPAGARPADVAAAREELSRVRAALEQAVVTADAGTAREPEAAYAPYHRRYLDQQRRMGMSIDALRDRVRQALAGASPRLAQLAELDAVLARLFAAREQQLLATVPACLGERFEQLRRQQPDDADAASRGAWRDTFAREFREALLAELELRLQPVAGMIDALSNEMKPHR